MILALTTQHDSTVFFLANISRHFLAGEKIATPVCPVLSGCSQECEHGTEECVATGAGAGADPPQSCKTGTMDSLLHPIEVRVLGSLLEKEITTPEYYPLSLNALVNACNQKSNRDPAVNFDEATVEQALHSLRDKGLLLSITGAGSRVQKYAHRISEKLNLGRPELAILCELMLRGPQTLGELRNRAERMHAFDDLEQVQSVIDRLPELIAKLERRPGEKESRFAQLLSGPPPASQPEAEQPVLQRHDRIAALESEVAQLRQELEDLRQQFAGFRKQFE